MKKLRTIWLCIAILATTTGCGVPQGIQTPPNEATILATRPPQTSGSTCTPEAAEISVKTYPLLQVKEDFKQLQDIVETKHPMLYTDKAELKELFITQYRLLKDNMTEQEFYRIISPVVAKIRCEHTKINLSATYQNYLNKNGKYLPAAIKVIDGKAYVLESLFPSDIPAASEVLSINGKKSEDIIQTLMNNIQADGDNTTEKLWLINLAFHDLYYYYIESPDSFAIELKDPATGTIRTANVPATGKGQLAKELKSFIPFEKRTVKLLDQAFEEKYAVLSVKSFYYTGENGIKEFDTFIDNFFATLAERKTPSVILDLRDNWGGDANRAAYLFSHLIQKAVPFLSEEFRGPYYGLDKPTIPTRDSFKGKLYILVNGGSNSATGLLASLLKYNKRGIIIGEETGGSFICTGMSQGETLRNTGMYFLCGTQTIGAAVAGVKMDGRGTMPDFAVTPTIEDMIRDKDVAMEHAINLIMKKK